MKDTDRQLIATENDNTAIPDVVKSDKNTEMHTVKQMAVTPNKFKTHVDLQTGVNNSGRLTVIIASVVAAITAAYTAIRRRRNRD